ncbi:MAG: cytochrome c oxidase assembly protein [Pseudomonadota bacterium]|nr:cytochrome c oxidase assembly protein [Pseudomonadota bacterium]
MALRVENIRMVGKLLVVAAGMFAFGYAMIPLYRAICEVTGINILSLGEQQIPGGAKASRARQVLKNSQVDESRVITVEFDANARGPWFFKPERSSMQVHPGELATVMYEFQNVQNRAMSAQAIPSYAPRQATAHFNKLECFCFNQYMLAPGEKKEWPVAFVIDPRIPKDVTTITLSYTFFEVGGQVSSPSPAGPGTAGAAVMGTPVTAGAGA